MKDTAKLVINLKALEIDVLLEMDGNISLSILGLMGNSCIVQKIGLHLHVF